MLEPTRLDVSNRLEVINLRINYLEKEMAPYISEIKALREEIELLSKLSDLYNQHHEDNIDIGRNKFNTKEKFSIRKAASDVSIISRVKDVLTTGSATTKEIATTLGLSTNQVSVALWKLRKNGLLETYETEKRNTWVYILKEASLKEVSSN